jgi:hypothetical protein
MAEPLDQVTGDFLAFLGDAASTHGHAFTALKFYLEKLAALPRAPGARMFVGQGDPNQPESRVYSAWPLDQLEELLGDKGHVAVELGRQWIVTVFAYWESAFRKRFADALGVPLDAVLDPMLGDIRRLRNDIVHHFAVATREQFGKCELLGHWATVGEPIVVTSDQVIEFMDHFGLVTKGGRFVPSTWAPTIDARLAGRATGRS